jgi:hypothetical protein
MCLIASTFSVISFLGLHRRLSTVRKTIETVNALRPLGRRHQTRVSTYKEILVFDQQGNLVGEKRRDQDTYRGISISKYTFLQIPWNRELEIKGFPSMGKDQELMISG